MEAVRTRGQAAAVAAGLALLRTGRVHAILLSGLAGVGKTTLARDLAAAAMCTAAEPRDRPCGTCRGCRMVASGNHPDVHRLVPDGPGGQIRIGTRTNPEPGTVRRLVSDLALMPVEGGARVAIVEAAHRMNDEAQSALLKTLEEPPAGAIIILCADEEERLLPTVRSRCARVRLGQVGARDIEGLLAEIAGVEPPLAGRLARLSRGRPGVALAYAAAPEAVATRGEIGRLLIDLLAARPAARLAAISELLARSAELARALDGGHESVGRVRTRRAAPADTAPHPEPAPDDAAAVPSRVPVAERRRAALTLLEAWRDVTRDLAVVALGEGRAVRDPELLEDLARAAAGLDRAAPAAFLERLDRAGELLEGNVSPELTMDALVLAWPRRAA